ncbi:hypothetical protein [Saccharopolyspora phatthalungensis]|uniref:Uncharacterized protein n=1 Tax=Saccharopolyspora phatthalungensis TaxID=664693 RepID=A0A840QEU4_9PSEU|nr:hypothetical protein [Saccharopolyspora phatthalungensis]MBB5158541.1 hypothetical protein [Saccharopolyspora phatthalungensis]
MNDYGTTAPSRRLLGVYLNDHLAGATAGVALARRIAKANRGSASGPPTARLAGQIAEDRAALLGFMRALDVRVNPLKPATAWLGEKILRLKPNQWVFARSPLSSVVELEALLIGVEGKDTGWRTLCAVAEYDDRLAPAELDELRIRARRQAEELEDLRKRSVHGILERSDATG